MKKRIISAVMALTMALSINTTFAAEKKISEIYVATTGDDANPGTIDQPLKTAEGARNKIRELKKSGEIGEKGAVVYFREGIYPFAETMVLEKEDSGTAEAPITYRNYLEEEVQFIGGININPADFQKVTDSKILNRLVEDTAKDSLYRVNLRTIGVKEIPMPYLLGNYSYWQVDGVVQEKSVIMADLVEALGFDRNAAKSPELYVNNKLMSVAKYPNEGYLKVDAVTEPGPFMRNWNDDIIGSADWVPPEDRVATPFRFINQDAKPRMEKWKNADQALLWGRWYWEWATQSVPLDYVVPTSGEIASKVSSAFSVRANQPWYIYNLLEEIDAPGEYFLDRETGYLYFHPEDGMEAVDEVVLTLLDGPTVKFDNAAYINFKGINSMRSRKEAFAIVSSDNIHISDAELAYTAGFAVTMLYSTNCTVKHCYVHDVDGGVRIDECGNMEKLIKANCGVENCEFDWFARLTATYTPAISIGGGCGNFARNNEIHNAQHMGIGFSGPYHEISFNNIYNVCQEADDSGAIYTGRNLTTHYGCIIKNNYIHDCTPIANYTVGTIAIYLDDFLSGITVVGNVIENMQKGGMFSGYNNEWTNNIFINNEFCSIVTAFSANISAAGLQPSLLAGWKDADYVRTEAWQKAFPDLAALTEENFTNDTVSTGCIVKNNLMVNSAGLDLIGTLTSHPENIVENNLAIEGDPGFVDMDNKIYLLKEDAKIFKDMPDFKPIPFTRIGRYSERAEARVKKALTLAIDSPYVMVDGQKQMINNAEPEQKPVIINDSTYVPFRFLCEALGMSVEYNEETRIATFDDGANKLEFSLDSLDKVKKGEEEITLEVPIRNINGRTYMPLRAISEMVDKEVFWDDRGFITVSDTENLFNSEADAGLIEYLHGKLSVY